MTNGEEVWYDKQTVERSGFSGLGEMSERLKEPVLKTGDAQASVGSNPTLSATTPPAPRRCEPNQELCRSTQVAEGAPLLRE